ncbi:hypothetical protein ABZ639_22555 [Saccharomonospora sp. NPDC006951]
MAQGKAAATISRLSSIGREMAERRALRERNAASVRKRSKESMITQGKVAARAAKHFSELGRRQKQAGGWSTGKSLADKSNVMGFGPDDDQRDATFSHNGKTSPSSSATPEPPEPEVSAPPAPPRRARHARREDRFDDDDFSNNSWLK